MRRYLTYLLILFPLSFACSLDLDFGDPSQARNGEYGRLRFSGGGGCNDSTTLAVGSTARLNLEPLQEQPLPADLSPRSSAPEIISATAGQSNTEIVLTAPTAGQALVEIVSGDEVYDRLGFDAEPAFSATSTVAGEVFSGGILAVKIDEIYGSCGEDCPLIGGDFIDWSTEPESILQLESYQDRLAVFIAGDPSQVTIIGREPSADRVILDRTIEVLPDDSGGVLICKATVMTTDDVVLDFESFPKSLQVGSLILLEMQKEISDGRLVPLSGRDVQWSIVNGQGVVEPWSETAGEQPLEGPVYEALAPGQVSLIALVPLTGDAKSFELKVTE